MRIGIDFDNTIICYDDVFINLAKFLLLVPPDYQGSKRELRDRIQLFPNGDLIWQRLQGKTYGALIGQATLFAGFKEFIETCNQLEDIEVFIVSHKTELGHFDENHINLRVAAREWLRDHGFFNKGSFHVSEDNIYFETTREEKIKRIETLQCTHFIDDLIEVLESPSFPKNTMRIFFQPLTIMQSYKDMSSYSNWVDIKNALFLS